MEIVVHTGPAMKHKGFYMPTILIFVLVGMMLTGIMLQKATANVRSINPVIGFRKSAEASRYGLKLAEDWLISAVLSNDIPARRYDAEGDPQRRVEAVRSNGLGVGADFKPSSFDLELYVGDTDYPESLFGGEMANDPVVTAIPRIPHVQTDSYSLNYYFLRSSAASPEGSSRMISEELLAVSRDKMAGEIDIRRLFYRTITE
jgi:hypothetical protein